MDHEMRSAHDRQRGQILPLFALAMIVILSIGALVLDGASMLVTRRHLQNAGDAAALAGANLIQKSGSGSVCSNTAGPPPGAPTAAIIAAVNASLATNYQALTSSNITISCPNGWDNAAVQVDLQVAAASFMQRAIGYSAPNVKTTSIAVNGQIAGSNYSVVLLDRSTASQQSSWPNGRRGCPSMLISGGPTIVFDGSVMIDSACAAASGGALAANGGSATVTLAAGKSLNMVGGYSLGPLTITPAPNTGVTPPLADPLGTLDPISTSPGNPMGLTQQYGSRLVLSNETRVLSPGIYTGGIQLNNSSVAILRPGVYVIDGGGLDIKAGASICSITQTSTATTCAGFATGDCPDTTCGVLILNKGTSATMGQVTVGANSTLKLRAYDERAMTSGGDQQYRNILLWQEGTPAASSSFAQPVVALQGGGSVEVSGTVYAPQAQVTMGGGSGGSGGSATNATLQFIAWDFTISGNASFHFYYSDNDFARPKDYGLVK
jgi:putative Flp pilus-assembly TadE/G-like protein